MAHPGGRIKDKKDETILDKIGTLGKKKKKEAQDVTEEGRNAIELPASPLGADLGPEHCLLEENEERSIIDPISRQDPKVKELIKLLIDWINDELAVYRILVKDLEEDLFDGQILQKLIEKLANIKVEVPEVTQSEIGQKQKLKDVLNTINQVLNISWSDHRWSVDSIHSKNLLSMLHLLVELVRAFKPPIRLPDNVVINMIVVQKKDNALLTSRRPVQITRVNEETGGRQERDAFDTLFDHAPDKLNFVKRSLVDFANKHLSKINLEVTDIDNQFHDGVYLVLLMGLLEGFFTPLYNFHLTPQTFENKVQNVNFAFELMVDCGLDKPKARPEDIVNLDAKSTLRVLYNLFTKYKNVA
ncbi:hypothetical protein HELRODRAFT_186951 [Helobdella robusta]|uniref:Calponin-homology (CH) domain-containing protein n=1 Tax=Helobdella robusta TaxID=6412 RepID=T1FP47_HELRO|nr:hypothetical protein HELRODRAFT_186951 [Helobdella robusta]ESO05197.1 hypothetical protein HELRODRAFT_186951 [Helobdella robusta]